METKDFREGSCMAKSLVDHCFCPPDFTHFSPSSCIVHSYVHHACLHLSSLLVSLFELIETGKTIEEIPEAFQPVIAFVAAALHNISLLFQTPSANQKFPSLSVSLGILRHRLTQRLSQCVTECKHHLVRLLYEWLENEAPLVSSLILPDSCGLLKSLCDLLTHATAPSSSSTRPLSSSSLLSSSLQSSSLPSSSLPSATSSLNVPIPFDTADLPSLLAYLQPSCHQPLTPSSPFHIIQLLGSLMSVCGHTNLFPDAIIVPFTFSPYSNHPQHFAELQLPRLACAKALPTVWAWWGGGRWLEGGGGEEELLDQLSSWSEDFLRGISEAALRRFCNHSLASFIFSQGEQKEDKASNLADLRSIMRALSLCHSHGLTSSLGPCNTDRCLDCAAATAGGCSTSSLEPTAAGSTSYLPDISYFPSPSSPASPIHGFTPRALPPSGLLLPGSSSAAVRAPEQLFSAVNECSAYITDRIILLLPSLFSAPRPSQSPSPPSSLLTYVHSLPAGLSRGWLHDVLRSVLFSCSYLYSAPRLCRCSRCSHRSEVRGSRGRSLSPHRAASPSSPLRQSRRATSTSSLPGTKCKTSGGARRKCCTYSKSIGDGVDVVKVVRSVIELLRNLPISQTHVARVLLHLWNRSRISPCLPVSLFLSLPEVLNWDVTTGLSQPSHYSASITGSSPCDFSFWSNRLLDSDAGFTPLVVFDGSVDVRDLWVRSGGNVGRILGLLGSACRGGMNHFLRLHDLFLNRLYLSVAWHWYINEWIDNRRAPQGRSAKHRPLARDSPSGENECEGNSRGW
eukprot:GHVS01025320.1.p1 GENE.GHVS01025320.1~~GHVS01025320.1.p1  ORF type:complete len:794 (+),score=122.62 GHVS01025320.1:61-2442(+)